MKSTKRKYEPFYYFLGYTVGVSGLILAQPNMSNAILVMAIGVCIYFVSGLKLKPLVYALPILAVLTIVLMLVIPHTRRRVVSVFRPHEQSSLDELYQSDQILIGLGAGGPFGVGVGQSIQKHSYTPELIGDSIFAIIGEEMGFLGSMIFIAVFAYFSYTMVTIVSNSVTLYEKMMGMGVVAWIFFQYIINLYSTIKLITPTGIPIPFISYGGSSMVFAMVGLGLIANIYRRQGS
jgi:cell division protein FtsW